MDIFTQALTVIQAILFLTGAALGIWGSVILLEKNGSDNPGAKSQGIKQFVAGAGVVLIGVVLVPLLANLFTVT